MKTFIVLFLFVGIFMVTHGIYEQKLKSISEEKKVVYKFIPRTLYEEQLSNNSVMTKMSGLFTQDSPWMKKN